jgi:hypothetical protein
MQLLKINEALNAYAQWLNGLKDHPEAYWWETVQGFQAHWNPEAADPVAMFERAIDNSVTRRPWQTENWYPKRMMTLFWQTEPQTVRWMFEDLFNETKDPEARIGRFLFGADALLADYRRAHPTKIENNHYHDDYRMIGLYLALRYPDAYAPYDFEAFQHTMAFLNARDQPRQNDLPRYNKVMRTLQLFIDKEPLVESAFTRLLNPRMHFTGKSLLPAADLCRFIHANLK